MYCKLAGLSKQYLMGNIITIENLSKKYTIGHHKKFRYQTLRDTLSESVGNVIQRLRHPFSPLIKEFETDEFWALKNINIEVKQGDRLGIIGRNGAGKSTLLKILSRITHPTTGRIHIIGRAASLLEVGTGFHPELTGRENIFLNGAILGMTKYDIRKRFDEIVDFAETEKFLDTPVKRYSSGMYVRLAFSVAAHLEPEILIVDEVLAVGDAQFQNKCLSKMEDIGNEGRTVIFVSHNMAALKSICNRAIILAEGRVDSYGSVHECIQQYVSAMALTHSQSDIAEKIRNLPVDQNIQIQGVYIQQNHVSTTLWDRGEAVEVSIDYQVLKQSPNLRIYFDLLNFEGGLILRSFHDCENENGSVIDPGMYRSVGVIPANILNKTAYILRIGATIYGSHSCTGDGISVLIEVGGVGLESRGYSYPVVIGQLSPIFRWSTEKLSRL